MTKVAIMGYGTVGSGLIELIDKNREQGKNDIIITSILVKDKNEVNDSCHMDVITDSFEDFIKSECDIIVELIGGIKPAYEYVKKALELKKHVVTANKDLIAQYGRELFILADENGVSLKFEASVGGGIPIIKPITETLCGNEISSIKAILNGTTNFILTKMTKEKISYEEALKEAQDLGFAEANPESDVMGYDAARKLAILATLSFDKNVDWNSINICGITEIDEVDIKYANKYGCKIKLVGEAYKENNSIYASIKPMLIDNNSIMAKVDNEVNIVVLNGDEIGELSFIGKGAGKLPTGSAVYGDLCDIINNRHVKIENFNKEEANINYYSNNTCNCILRIKTTDKDEVVEECRQVFNNMKILDRSFYDEVDIFIECTSEAYIQKLIDKISNEDYYIGSKKLIFS